MSDDVSLVSVLHNKEGRLEHTFARFHWCHWIQNRSSRDLINYYWRGSNWFTSHNRSVRLRSHRGWKNWNGWRRQYILELVAILISWFFACLNFWSTREITAADCDWSIELGCTEFEVVDELAENNAFALEELTVTSSVVKLNSEELLALWFTPLAAAKAIELPVELLFDAIGNSFDTREIWEPNKEDLSGLQILEVKADSAVAWPGSVFCGCKTTVTFGNVSGANWYCDALG